jgi:hypothetical protein
VGRESTHRGKRIAGQRQVSVRFRASDKANLENGEIGLVVDTI